MKMLAVDDDQSIRELLPMILAEAGITDVTVASSAEKALSAIRAQAEPFECFLLDIQMPGGDGIELCEDIRRLPAYRITPIIMLTATQEKSFVDDAFAAGATDYATKPIVIAEVCARVRMAKLLVEEQRKVRDLSAEAGKSGEDSAENPKADFAERLDLAGVIGLVSTQAFGNYLGQLSRAGFQSSSFFAVHVQHGRQIYDRCTSSEFEYALRHVADAIIARHKSGAVIMCYVGGGNFICSSSSATLQTAELLEDEVQNILDDKDLTYDDGAPLDIEVAIGATVQPLLSKPLGLEDLESQAIKRAMIRVSDKSAKPNLVNIRRISV